MYGVHIVAQLLFMWPTSATRISSSGRAYAEERPMLSSSKSDSSSFASTWRKIVVGWEGGEADGGVYVGRVVGGVAGGACMHLVYFGHHRLYLAAERASDAAGEVSGDTDGAALQHADPAATAECVAARECNGAEQQLEADGAGVILHARRTRVVLRHLGLKEVAVVDVDVDLELPPSTVHVEVVVILQGHHLCSSRLGL